MTMNIATRNDNSDQLGGASPMTEYSPSSLGTYKSGTVGMIETWN